MEDDEIVNVLTPEKTQELLNKWNEEIAAMEKRQDVIAAEIQGRYDAATAEETDPNCPFADN